MIYNFLAVTLNIEQKLIELGDPFKVQDISLLLSRFIGILLIAAAIASLFYLIMGGIQWITSGGDKAGVTAAREKITAAFIGLAIVATAWAVFLLIQWFFGFTILGGLGGAPGAYRCSIPGTDQPGQECERPGWCDIAGGCNIACCATDADCQAAGHAPTCYYSNGYCQSGRSCGPVNQ